MSLRLHLSIATAADTGPMDLGPETTHWIGAAAVGGTLDTTARGGPDGPPLRCAIRDVVAGQAGPPARAGTLAAWDLVQINPGDLRAPEGGAGALLVVGMDVAPEAEDEFNEWYDTEHVPALRAVPGVLCGRRFRSEAGSPRYVAVYHLQGRETYAEQPGWLAMDQTPWIRRLRRFQRDRTYFMFRPDPDA